MKIDRLMDEKTSTKIPDPGGTQEEIDLFDNPEPWMPIETKLVVWSFVIALIALVIFGFLINKFILDAF